MCVDAGYYRFLSPAYIEGLVKQTRRGFKLCFKVTDEITTRTFPNLPRHGERAGKRNEHFTSMSATLSAGVMLWKRWMGSWRSCRKAGNTGCSKG